MKQEAKRSNVLLVGAGAYGEAHAAAIEAADGVHLVGVVDDHIKRAELVARQYGVGPWARLDDALATLDVDVVAIVVPTVAHAAVALRALQAGAHVLIEKPVCLSRAAAAPLVLAATEAGLVVDVVSQRRFQAANFRLKQFIEQGGLGAIGTASCDTSVWRSDAYFSDAPWRGQAALGGGNLLNHGMHALDLLVWFLGELSDAASFVQTSRHPEADIEESLASAMRFAEGSIATLQASLVANPGGRMELVLTGDGGTARVYDDHVEVSRLDANGSSVVERWESGDVEDALVAQYENLHSSITRHAPLRVGLDSALQTLDAANLILDAAVQRPAEQLGR